MANHLVFVYGTLKKGQPNDYVMTLHGHVIFKGQGHTTNPFPLVIGSRWNLPLLMNVKGEGKIVQGEIYEVDDEALVKFDEFEGHPNLYLRQKIDISLTEGTGATKESRERIVKCWTYFFTDCRQEYLELPTLESYDSKGDHGMEYNSNEDVFHPDDL